MMWLVGIFSLLVAAAGWFYMFYSQAAEKLAIIEQPDVNRRRVRMRRLGGTCMILLGASFYVCCDALIDRDAEMATMMLMAVFLLLAAVLVLALIDLRLTRALRRKP